MALYNLQHQATFQSSFVAVDFLPDFGSFLQDSWKLEWYMYTDLCIYIIHGETFDPLSRRTFLADRQ